MIVHFGKYFKYFSKRGVKMSRAGVICEFNPFHNGHKFLLEKIKEAYADEIVCIMSGNFVQRGDIAVADKYSRAAAALQNGADIVIELPTAYAVSGAQTFAENGVRIAKAMNCDILCFGAESDIEKLLTVTKILNSDETNRMIADYMDQGYYYPKALSIAVGEAHADIISRPNNILALEYIKACQRHGIRPVAIQRKGVEHDDEIMRDNIASASKIREMIVNHDEYHPYTPMTIDSPCTISAIEPAILYRLKTITPEELRKIADVSEGLENRITEAAKKYNSLSEICEAIKTKRYTMARIRRILIAAFLNITTDLQRTPVPYLRVLGLKSGKESLLSNAKLPLIVKTKVDYDRLDFSAKEIFDLDLRAAEALNIAKGGIPINEFSQGIIKQ